MSDPAAQTPPTQAAHEGLQERLLDAALPHVPFDGWSPATLRAAARDAGVTEPEARAACPRGALDLAAAYHRRGDDAMAERLEAEDFTAARFRDRVARAVRYRIEAAGDREAVRRGSAFFALPLNAPEGARLIWGTADRIWTALGDTSDDLNWYSKRATLSGVYGATVLYWLGDDSPGHNDTWEFLDRRIDDVMQIEKLKAQMRKVPVVGPLLDALNKVKPPSRLPRTDLPGVWPQPPR